MVYYTSLGKYCKKRIFLVWIGYSLGAIADLFGNEELVLFSIRAIIRQKSSIPIIKKVVDELVVDSQRFIQTGIGWTLSDLSRYFPDQAQEIVEHHFDKLSKEVISRHTKYMPKHNEYKKQKTQFAESLKNKEKKKMITK